jgi:hypothetical protein
MWLLRTTRCIRAAILFASVVAAAGSAQAFSGQVNYTGSLGPIRANRPLCICVYRNPDLTGRIGCVISNRNNVAYDTGALPNAYYAIGFVDLTINERLDADEPYVIYDQRAASPADPIDGGAEHIDFVFGDENLGGAATPTATEPPDASPTPTATADETPTEPVEATPTATAAETATVAPTIAGDCDDDGIVSVDELVRAVGIALESLPLSACVAADRDGDGTVRIEELIAALNVALTI